MRSAQLCRTGEPCLNAANPRFGYSAIGFDVTETAAPDPVDGIATLQRVVELDQHGRVRRRARRTPPSNVPITKNAAEWAQTPALGLMIVTSDNKAGTDEAQTIKVK